MRFTIIALILFSFQISFSQKEKITITSVDSKNQSVSDSIANTINKTKKSLEKSLFNKGYFNYVLVDSTTLGFEKNYTIKYNERLKYLKLKKDTLTKNLNILKNFKTDNLNYIIPFEKVELVLEKISEYFKNSGYLFTEVYLSKIAQQEKESISASLKINIKEDIRTLDKVVIKGYEKFPKGFLKHYLKFKLNKPINFNDLQTKNEDLLNLEFVDEIKSPELLFTKDSTTIYLYLKKVSNNNFDGFIGFNTDEDTKKLQFNGYLNLLLQNNLNYGETLEIKYKSDESEQKNFEASLDLPYLFSSPLGVEARLNIFNRDSVFTLSTTELKTYYLFNQKLKTAISYESTNSSNLDETGSSFIEDYKSIYIGTTFEYRKRNLKSRLLNTRTKIFLKLKSGNRNTLDTKTKQNAVELKIKKLIDLNDKNKILTKVDANKLFSNNYFTNELYRFGGIRSIRGFNENSLEADFYSIIGLEYHYLLSPALSINSITDFGYLENTVISTKTQIYGFGFGLSAITKAGVLRMNFANGKSKNDEFKFSNTKVHLSLTAFF